MCYEAIGWELEEVTRLSVLRGKLGWERPEVEVCVCACVSVRVAA